MPLWKLYYHAVWSTNGREPLLIAELHCRVAGAIRNVAKAHHVIVDAIGVMPDHVHIAFSAPPSIVLATFVGRMKGSSSRLINTLPRSNQDSTCSWQSEYGLLSFSEKGLPDVVAYVDNQPARHAANRTWRILETHSESEAPANLSSDELPD